MSDKSDNFNELKQLLKLKRHEIPPPGYFGNFSSEVISRIRAGEACGGDTLWERWRAESPFMAKVFYILTAKPGLIGGLATSMCLCLLLGVVLLDRSESGQMLPDTAMSVQPSAARDAASPWVASAAPLESPEGGVTVTTNPVASLQPVSSLFGTQQNPLFQSVDFVPANR
ncbi:MAG TPA: hypothetical protein VL970_06865 [Candidatus Acidoferrales bacterium]|nr:hypothetical protein [Candidatus Acidoferrales bacterium]